LLLRGGDVYSPMAEWDGPAFKRDEPRSPAEPIGAESDGTGVAVWNMDALSLMDHD